MGKVRSPHTGGKANIRNIVLRMGGNMADIVRYQLFESGGRLGRKGEELGCWGVGALGC